MSLTDPLVLAALLAATIGVVFFAMTFVAVRKRKYLGTAVSVLSGLLMLSLSALFGTVGVAIQGYRALTREELAATVRVEPVGAQKFAVRVVLPDGSEKAFSLAGDELYVDAHILKWKPLANVLGLHTSYELDRVAGRYASLDDERAKERTVYSLSADRPLDMFQLRRRYAIFRPLLDAEYGSAAFVNTRRAEEFKVYVSTSGLLIRMVDPLEGPR